MRHPVARPDERQALAVDRVCGAHAVGRGAEASFALEGTIVVVAVCSALCAAARGPAARTLRSARRLATGPGRGVAVRRVADLVKLLALAPGYRMPRDELLEILWPKLGENPAPSNLHKARSYARRALMRRRVWRAVTGQLPRASCACCPTSSRGSARSPLRRRWRSRRELARGPAVRGLGFSARRIHEI